MHLLINSIRNYDWGAPGAISEILGRDTTTDPEAELWMGDHPVAPSRVRVGTEVESLADLIAAAPLSYLGPRLVDRGAKALPFLFKILAAGRALSIQAHPDREQAREGFDREELRGIPIDAPHRNYRDANHKPEILCALTDFWALAGFREAAEITALLEACNDPLADRARTDLDSGSVAGYRSFLSTLLSASKTEVESFIASASEALPTGAERRWIETLSNQHPADVGSIAPLFLNLLRLLPGESVFLGAGELHAYLSGTGVELMASSDNVLRGGLTTKHVDREELSRVLRFRPFRPEIRTPLPVSPGVTFYKTDAEEFELLRLDVETKTNAAVRIERDTPSIVLITSGNIVASSEAVRENLTRGESMLLLPSESIEIKGEGTAFVATCPVPN